MSLTIQSLTSILFWTVINRLFINRVHIRRWFSRFQWFALLIAFSGKLLRLKYISGVTVVRVWMKNGLICPCLLKVLLASWSKSCRTTTWSWRETDWRSKVSRDKMYGPSSSWWTTPAFSGPPTSHLMEGSYQGCWLRCKCEQKAVIIWGLF